jgi:hypothetical protein
MRKRKLVLKRDDYIPEGNTMGKDIIHRKLWLEEIAREMELCIQLDERMPVENMEDVPFGDAHAVQYNGITVTHTDAPMTWADVFKTGNYLAYLASVPTNTRVTFVDSGRTKGTVDMIVT